MYICYKARSKLAKYLLFLKPRRNICHNKIVGREAKNCECPVVRCLLSFNVAYKRSLTWDRQKNDWIYNIRLVEIEGY